MAAYESSLCRIELLGTLRVVVAGETVTQFPRQKAARLLTFLALHPGQAQLRERLVDLFWPDLDLPAGRASLSTTLTALRHLLKCPKSLLTTHQTIRLNWSVVTTDVSEFERLVSRAEQEILPQRVETLKQALELYRGEACAGIYEDWALRASERLHDLYVHTLSGLTTVLEALGDVEEARRAAAHWADTDPYSEEAHVRLIALQIRAGALGDARSVAKSLAQRWQEEFGAALSPAVQIKIAALLNPSAETSSSGVFILPVVLPAIPVLPAASLDSFFGREAEQAWLSVWLQERKARLVTVVGPGGMGKTRLALDFAAGAGQHATPYFVPLADTADPSQILAAIVRTLDLPPAPDPVGQIAAFFASIARPLLILDNLEQLLVQDQAEPEGEAARIILVLLAATPHLFCLCTSRLALGLRGERLLPIHPLALPPEDNCDDNLERYTSVQLYLDRARAVRPDFSLTPQNAPSVCTVCRLLDGSPLALELAASWVRLLPPRAMAERLTRQTGMTTLENRRPDVPARHHSLRAALDWSWRLLTLDQQSHLRQVSVFRGTWSLDAAETICREPNSLSLLANLLEASLLRVSEKNGETRYSLLETVRQYAREQLEAAGEADTCRASHVAYFLDRVMEAKLNGLEQTQEMDRLEAEHDNIRAALDFCRDDSASVLNGLKLAAALLPFWRARGYLKEGEEQTSGLLSQPDASARTAARAAALNAAGVLAMLQSAYDRATTYHEEAQEIFREIGDVGGEAGALHGLGSIAHFKQDYPAARILLEAALAGRQPGTDQEIAASWHSLGGLALREGNTSEAAACYERALCLRRRRDDWLSVAGTLGGLGQVAFADKNYSAAADYMQETIRLFDAAGQRWSVAISLDVLSQVAFLQGRPERAARLLAASMRIREKYHFRIPPVEHEEKNGRIAEMASLLGTPAFETAWNEGRALPWPHVIAYAQSDTDASPADAIATELAAGTSSS